MSKTINISFVGDDGQIWYADGYVDYQLKEKDKKIETLQNDLDREKSKVKEYGSRMLKAIEYIHNNYPVCAGKELLEILQDDNKQRKGEVMSLEELESYEPKNIEEQEYYDNFWN